MKNVHPDDVNIIRVMIAVLALAVVAIVGMRWNTDLERQRFHRKNADHENMVKIHSAIQQYIVEYELQGTAEFVSLWGREAAGWEEKPFAATLVGYGGYLRTVPEPVAEGVFLVNDTDSFPTLAPVVHINDGEHVTDFAGYKDGRVLGSSRESEERFR